jgi:hypothetical protein
MVTQPWVSVSETHGRQKKTYRTALAVTGFSSRGIITYGAIQKRIK